METNLEKMSAFHLSTMLMKRKGVVRRDSAVKLVDDLAGASPARAGCPVGTVVISGDGAGDQAVGSPEVNVLEGWTQVWPAPTGGQAKQQLAAQANRSQAPKSTSSLGSEGEGSGNAETFIPCRRPMFPAKYWVRATGKFLMIAYADSHSVQRGHLV